MSTRSSIVMAAVTIGALTLGAAAVIGAFVVVDDRAAQILQSGPQIVHAEKKAAPAVRSSRTAAGSGGVPTQVQTVGSAASGAPTASRHGRTGEPMPETTLDGRNKRRTEAHHGGSRHGRHLARSSHDQPDSGAATGAAQGAQGGQSALFFPFR